jgi:formyl-CoA transferase
MCGTVLADLGAEIIKVELPEGDVGRAIGPNLPGINVGIAHATVNRNKQSLCIDTRTDEGKEIVLKIAAESDILIENFKVGTMARYGLGYPEIRELKPDIVYVSITGWGQFGPNHEAAGYDPLAQAASGFLSINGTPEGPPTKAGTWLADDLGGLHGAIGAIAALRHRDQTGEGQHVDIALQDAMLFQSNGLPTLGALGVEPGRNGNEFGFATPANVYHCADGPIYVGVLLDSHWKILARLMGQEDLADNPTFAERDSRVLNRDLCNMMVSEWLANQSRADAINLLREARLPVAPVNSFVDAAKDAHVQERDMLQQVEHADGVNVPITGPAAKFSRTPTRVRSAAPSLGEHNANILAALGYDQAARKQLVENGVINGDRPDEVPEITQ